MTMHTPNSSIAASAPDTGERMRLASDRNRVKLAEMVHAIGHLVVHLTVTLFVVRLWSDIIAGMAGWPLWLLFVASLFLLSFSYFCLGLMMHEGAHGHLSPNRRISEVLFQICGCLLQTVPTLYRELHWRHHKSPNENEDWELIPETDGALTPLQRRRALWRLALFGGLERNRVQEKFLWNGRIPLRKEAVRRARRELILLKIILIGGTIAWIVGLGFTSWAVGYAVPAIVGGWLLVWLQLIEHFGMAHGRCVEATRDVVPSGALQRCLYWAMYHVNYHSLHHDDASIPGHALPGANSRWTEQLRMASEPTPLPFAGYLAALRNMLPDLLAEIRPNRKARSTIH